MRILLSSKKEQNTDIWIGMSEYESYYFELKGPGTEECLWYDSPFSQNSEETNKQNQSLSGLAKKEINGFPRLLIEAQGNFNVYLIKFDFFRK